MRYAFLLTYVIPVRITIPGGWFYSATFIWYDEHRHCVVYLNSPEVQSKADVDDMLKQAKAYEAEETGRTKLVDLQVSDWKRLPGDDVGVTGDRHVQLEARPAI